MALPAIAPYSYTDNEHANRVSWPVDPSRAVLLVHDLQEHFVRAFSRTDENGNELPEAQINIAIANTRRLLDTAHAAGIPVYYTAQPPRQDPADRRLLIDFWGDGMQDDEGAQILPAIAPAEGDTVLTKWRYSAFVRSDFEQRLKDSGRDQLIIVGVYAHIGCLTTALEAFMRDIQPFMVADGLADFSEEEHRMACEYASGRCARVLSTDEVLADIASFENGAEA
ncbi:MAG: isochorismatase family protein [Rothia sp. (in: high G+C Gram-positive bacteria)]|uniref:isochorismatase family protein n=1 Tax=Rothia sp. (in: high G+C Gram-positive bacteria) TaxID=1885016 RepID=UPI0026E0C87C|nr:isochorismatase family protein [Rothia sp. (in: high G+C Gram-positive bacteria)]MDO5749817.1 isochorismatase family protein [Rothia sp. (in: high G+C Gram-positive bacteria)]